MSERRKKTANRLDAALIAFWVAYLIIIALASAQP